MRNVLVNLGRVAAQRWRLRTGTRRLERLEDRMLADIGISRSGIHAAVRGRRTR